MASVSTRLKDAPDLAIEVIWTGGGVDNLEVCRKLAIGEVRDGAVLMYRLNDEHYTGLAPSPALPDLDVNLPARLPDSQDQTRALLALRDSLQQSERGFTSDRRGMIRSSR